MNARGSLGRTHDHSRLFFRRGCASTPSHGLCFPRESRLKRGILSTRSNRAHPERPFGWEPEESPRAGLVLLKGCTTSRRSSTARAAPYFLREPRFGRAPPRRSRRQGADRRLRFAVREPRTRVWPLALLLRRVMRRWIVVGIRRVSDRRVSRRVVVGGKNPTQVFPPQPKRAALKRYKFIREKENHDRHPWAG